MNAIRYPTSTAALRVMRGRAVGIHGRPAGGRHRRIVENAMKEGGGNIHEAVFWKRRHNGNDADDPCPAGLHRLFRLEPRQYHLLGQENAAPAGVRSGRLLLCGGAGRAGQDHPAHHRRQLRAGVFPLVSVPTVVGCAGALLIVVAAIATPIARTQKMRELWFYVMSGGRGPEDRHHGDRAARALRPRGEFLDCQKRSVKTF